MGQNDALAYAAGVLDGDGYFSVIKGRNPRYDHAYCQAKIGVKQLWPGQALCFLARILGGKVVRVNVGLRASSPLLDGNDMIVEPNGQLSNSFPICESSGSKHFSSWSSKN